MENSKDKLLVLWTSDNKETALNMVFMYAENSKLNGWWNDIILLMWGGSLKLVSDDEDIQEYLEVLQKVGVKLIACRRCAENYNLVERLKTQNIDVMYTGELLSDWLKSGNKLLTV